ncbi:RloB family protein [Desulfovibrio sp. UCD-KL4C]|uniref:RloB family protein n=1 Tax=Desulfovibrio sp. UCD-KL4C TaxID=2578120 RepID=UPI0025BD521B|nr:RloB family protein [Desulfovibrio sp. UCD-KL4C]
MARPKITPKNQRRQNINILLICDGRTEINYAKYVLNSCVSSKSNTIKIDARKLNSIEAAQKHILICPTSFDAVFFLTDLENTQLSETKINSLITLQNSAKKLSNKRTKWAVFFNYPSIEYWYILHFAERAKSFMNATEAKNFLKQKYSIYEKPMPRNRQEAEIFCAKLESAIINCNNLNTTGHLLPYANRITSHIPLTNPMTEMPNLIDMIKKTKPTNKN